MKRFLIPFLVVFVSFGFSCQLNAQKDKKEKKVTIKIEKEDDGKKVNIDTTFTLKEGEDIDKVLEKYGIETEVLHLKHAKKFKFDIETDDSLSKESNAMVWISVDDDDVHEHIIRKSGNDKMIFISEGNDEDVKVIELKEGSKVDWNETDEEVFIEKLNDDSVKIKKKIIIKKAKDGKHKIKSKGGVYIISDDVSIDFDDKFDDENVIIEEIKKGNDSIDIIVRHIKKGKHGKKIVIKSGGDYTWTIDEDEDVVFNGEDLSLDKVKIEILDIDETGMKALKQKKDYKEFKDKDFDVFVDNKKKMIKFQFSTSKKGTLSVKIIDEKGKIIFEDVDKKFDGKYKNEIAADSGTYYIQISQGKNHFLRKIIFEKGK